MWESDRKEIQNVFRTIMAKMSCYRTENIINTKWKK